MSSELATFAIYVLLFWIAVQLVNELWQRRRRQSALSNAPSSSHELNILPTFRLQQQQQQQPAEFELERQNGSSSMGDTEFIVTSTQINVNTTRFNALLHRIAAGSRSRMFKWRLWFQIGAIISKVAMVASCFIMFYAFWRLVSFQSEPSSSSSHFVKRDQQSLPKDRQSRAVLIPLIPGLTFPMADILYFAAAIAAATIVHEAGHAIASEAEGIAISSVGFILMVIMPGAYVSLPSDLVDDLAARRRLRIVCAGVWHNIVVAFTAWLIIASKLPSMAMHVMGYRQLGMETDSVGGVVVDSIVRGSALDGHVFSGSEIHKLDDVVLSSGISSWNSVLLGHLQPESHSPTYTRGFCVPVDFRIREPTVERPACCQFDAQNPNGRHSQSGDESTSCFAEFGATRHQQQLQAKWNCLPLRETLISKRCTTSADCSGSSSGSSRGGGNDKIESLCYQPYSEDPAYLPLRLLVSNPPWMTPAAASSTKHFKDNAKKSSSRVVVYWGDRDELWHDITVSTVRRLYWMLPRGLPLALDKLLLYLLSLNLGFAAINILPVLYLDGEFAFKALVEMHVLSSSVDATAASAGSLTVATALRYPLWVDRFLKASTAFVLIIVLANVMLSLLSLSQ
ncbi:hypothetical protein GQ42DRAFT_26970 [Ramicandelaber brevisporus]|nr:hypothetical protein GQ42DRAFT_26970 [Ramicandelaber brevisporus]